MLEWLSDPAVLTAIAIGLLLPLTALGAATVYAVAAGTHPLTVWSRTGILPVGRSWLFTRILRVANPFCAVLSGLSVLKLEKGSCTVSMKETNSVRNPFHSIHAGALATLGETACGLAVLSSFRDGKDRSKDRALPTKLTSEYLKKARGKIVATAKYQPKVTQGKHTEDIVAEITNSAGEVVARVTTTFVVENQSSQEEMALLSPLLSPPTPRLNLKDVFARLLSEVNKLQSSQQHDHEDVTDPAASFVTFAELKSICSNLGASERENNAVIQLLRSFESKEGTRISYEELTSAVVTHLNNIGGPNEPAESPVSLRRSLTGSSAQIQAAARRSASRHVRATTGQEASSASSETASFQDTPNNEQLGGFHGSQDDLSLLHSSRAGSSNLPNTNSGQSLPAILPPSKLSTGSETSSNPSDSGSQPNASSEISDGISSISSSFSSPASTSAITASAAETGGFYATPPIERRRKLSTPTRASSSVREREKDADSLVAFGEAGGDEHSMLNATQAQARLRVSQGGSASPISRHVSIKRSHTRRAKAARDREHRSGDLMERDPMKESIETIQRLMKEAKSVLGDDYEGETTTKSSSHLASSTPTININDELYDKDGEYDLNGNLSASSASLSSPSIAAGAAGSSLGGAFPSGSANHDIAAESNGGMAGPYASNSSTPISLLRRRSLTGISPFAMGGHEDPELARDMMKLSESTQTLMKLDNERKERIFELEGELDLVKVDLEASIMMRDNLAQTLQATEDMRLALEHENNILKKKLAEMEKKNSQLSSANEEWEGKHTSLLQSMEAARKETDLVRRQIQSLEDSFSATQREWEQERASLIEAAAEAAAIIAEQKKTIQKLEATAASEESELQRLQSDVQNMRSAQNEMEKSMTDLKKSLDFERTQNQALCDEIATAREQPHSLEVENERLRKDLLNSRNELSTVRDELTRALEESDVYHTQMLDRASSLPSLATALRRGDSNLATELEEVSSREIGGLVQELQDVNTALRLYLDKILANIIGDEAYLHLLPRSFDA